MEIIVPAAGLSSRYPGTKPKYLLRDTKGKLMLRRAIEPYLEKYNITVGILADHDTRYNSLNIIKHEFNNTVNVTILPTVSNGPAETVYEILMRSSIDHNSSMLIKDCDSFFDHTVTNGNYVCISKIQDHDLLYRISNKSFVIVNNQNIVQNIVEKRVVSDTFNVGGYKFNKISEYLDTYQIVKNDVSVELFVSHIIQYAINNGIIFETKLVSNYVDVGTLEDWISHNA